MIEVAYTGIAMYIRMTKHAAIHIVDNRWKSVILFASSYIDKTEHGS